MILPRLGYWKQANKKFDYYSTDSPQYWKVHKTEKLEYRFNSRGYRDQEWPLQGLENCTWSVGDCHWMGIGLDQHKTTPSLLETQLGERVVNVSVGGPPQRWIRDRSMDILREIKPNRMIVSWTRLDRDDSVEARQHLLNKKWNTFYRSIKDPSWPDSVHRWEFLMLPLEIQQEIQKTYGWDQVHWLTDEERLVAQTRSANLQNSVDDLIQCIRDIETAKGNTTVVHLFAPINPRDKLWYPWIMNRLQEDHPDMKVLEPFKMLDLGRDDQHYGENTSKFLADQLFTMLNTVGD